MCNHTFDYLQRVGFCTTHVTAHRRANWSNYVYVYANTQGHIISESCPGKLDAFFHKCATSESLACGSYDYIVVGVGAWDKVFINSATTFRQTTDALLQRLRAHEPRAKLIVRTPTPLGLNSTEFQGSRDGRAASFNADMPAVYVPILVDLAAKHQALLVNAFDVVSSFPPLPALWTEKATVGGALHNNLFHYHCGDVGNSAANAEGSVEFCSWLNRSLPSLAVASLVKRAMCGAWAAERRGGALLSCDEA